MSAETRLTHATNWAGNYGYKAGLVHRPSSLDELGDIVGRSERVRVLGTRHSFSDIADSLQLITLDGLPGEISVDHEANRVAVPASRKYAQLAVTRAIVAATERECRAWHFLTVRSVEGVERERDGLVDGQCPALFPCFGERIFVELVVDR